MIDAVIIWVDGEDPVHLKKRIQFKDPSAHANAVGQGRFFSSGEVRFAVLSLLKFCPFLRHIHIVTDAQRPKMLDHLLNDGGKVRIVDHKDIFAGHTDLLPVFNTRSIEAMIHRVPNLAEKYIYLNDDFFVGRPMQETDFFENGLPVLQGSLKRFPNPIIPWVKSKLGLNRPGHKRAQQAGARMAGRRDTHLLFKHHPHPLRRSTLAKFYAANPQILREQARHRFRSIEQFSPVALSNHLEIAAGARVIPPVSVGYVKPSHPSGSALAAVMEGLNNEVFASLCVQNLEAMTSEDRAVVLAGLEKRYADVS